MKINERAFEIALAKSGKSAIQVAVEIGIHPSMLSRYKKGHFDFPKKYSKKILQSLSSNESELFEKGQNFL